MFRKMIPAGFKNIEETDDIRINIYIRMVNAVTYTCLCRKMNHNIKMILVKKRKNQFFFTDRSPDKYMFDIG